VTEAGITAHVASKIHVMMVVVDKSCGVMRAPGISNIEYFGRGTGAAHDLMATRTDEAAESTVTAHGPSLVTI
jgi:CO dehydrogenase nickel-insertion accessory protein CooC1